MIETDCEFNNPLWHIFLYVLTFPG